MAFYSNDIKINYFIKITQKFNKLGNSLHKLKKSINNRTFKPIIKLTSPNSLGN